MDVNSAKDRTASECVERLALGIQERARRLEVLDRQALTQGGRELRIGASGRKQKGDGRRGELPGWQLSSLGEG